MTRPRNLRCFERLRLELLDGEIIEITPAGSRHIGRPAGGDYHDVAEYQPGDVIVSSALGDEPVRASDVLGPALG